MYRAARIFASILVFSATTATAAPPVKNGASPIMVIPDDMPGFDVSTCAWSGYPREALERAEQGVTTLGLLFGTDGSLRRVEVVGPSSSPLLDAVAQAGVSSCRFRLALVQGQALERWRQADIIWRLDDSQVANLAWMLDVAAAKGRAAAEYALYVMLSLDSAPPSRSKTMELTRLLRRSAEGGHCPAKYVLGQIYEQGTAVKANLAQARYWYAQASACGNPAAAARLQETSATQ